MPTLVVLSLDVLQVLHVLQAATTKVPLLLAPRTHCGETRK